tara:strand:+ start:1743 stop:2519 length:777 start_codon:yes stop_codon:yes gene_type:complete
LIENFYYYIIWQLSKIPKKTFAKKRFYKTANLRNPYRYYLFQELVNLYGIEYFKNKKILEIGPKDGEDTLRLETLQPESITLIELPLVKNKNHHLNKFYTDYLKSNLEKLNVKNKLIFANFQYMSKDEYDLLGKFDLIWFTGVLYHNPEQLKLIKKLYNLLEYNGVLVLETSTTRNSKLKKQTAIEIKNQGHYFFPTKKAVNLMLSMVGFEETYESKCFNKENFNKNNIRMAVIAKKNKTDSKKFYRSEYIFGEATQP